MIKSSRLQRNRTLARYLPGNVNLVRAFVWFATTRFCHEGHEELGAAFGRNQRKSGVVFRMVMLVNSPPSEERRHATVYQQTPTGHHRNSQWLGPDSFSRHDPHAGVYRGSDRLACQPARALEAVRYLLPR